MVWLVFPWFPMVRWCGICLIKQNGKFHIRNSWRTLENYRKIAETLHDFIRERLLLSSYVSYRNPFPPPPGYVMFWDRRVRWGAGVVAKIRPKIRPSCLGTKNLWNFDFYNKNSTAEILVYFSFWNKKGKIKATGPELEKLAWAQQTLFEWPLLQ